MLFQHYVSSEVLTIAALVFLFLILLIPIIGAGVAVVLFALLIVYPSAFRIFSPTLLLFYIGFLIILIACALIYFILALRDRPLLYIQVVCYIFTLLLLLAIMWDKYVKTPSIADMLSVLLIVLLIILIIAIFIIPLFGSIASIIMFVVLLISGESIVTPNNIPFLTYGLIIFIICAIIYIILTIRVKTNILALVQAACYCLPAFVLIMWLASLESAVAFTVTVLLFGLGVSITRLIQRRYPHVKKKPRHPMKVALKIKNKRIGDTKLKLTKKGPKLSLHIRTPEKQAKRIIKISKLIARKVYPIFSTRLAGYFDEELDITLRSLGRKIISFHEQREEFKKEKYFYRYAKRRASEITFTKDSDSKII
ncbi:MAG: hypothetical protein EU529_01275 [Promethearchaeota archaeon]|nr:MAG: hypothetical protein EU529_01275 [Candidatus Lokiarchaeota archaeon]